MDLFKEILINTLEKEKVEISFPNFTKNIGELFEKECYQALQKIKEILNDDSFDDKECFYRIEEIVKTFEELGCIFLIRHDFG